MVLITKIIFRIFWENKIEVRPMFEILKIDLSKIEFSKDRSIQLRSEVRTLGKKIALEKTCFELNTAWYKNETIHFCKKSICEIFVDELTIFDDFYINWCQLMMKINFIYKSIPQKSATIPNGIFLQNGTYSIKNCLKNSY